MNPRKEISKTKFWEKSVRINKSDINLEFRRTFKKRSELITKFSLRKEEVAQLNLHLGYLKEEYVKQKLDEQVGKNVDLQIQMMMIKGKIITLKIGVGLMTVIAIAGWYF